MAELDRSLIRSLPLFSDMNDAELDALLGPARSRRVPAGKAVFAQGQSAEEFFVLLHGRLKVTRVTPDGQQVVVRMVNPGDLFGIAKALNRTDYPGTATAASESLVLAWPMGAWDGMIRRHPSLAVNTMMTVGQRLQEAHTRILEMSTQDVEHRVAHAVLRLIGESGEPVAEGIRVDFPVSRQDIAQMTGTTLHTVSRVLRAWEQAGLVKGGRQTIVVTDPERLRRHAEETGD